MRHLPLSSTWRTTRSPANSVLVRPDSTTLVPRLTVLRDSDAVSTGRTCTFARVPTASRSLAALRPTTTALTCGASTTLATPVAEVSKVIGAGGLPRAGTTASVTVRPGRAARVSARVSFTVTFTGRPATDVAGEVMTRSDWAISAVPVA